MLHFGVRSLPSFWREFSFRPYHRLNSPGKCYAEPNGYFADTVVTLLSSVGSINLKCVGVKPVTFLNWLDKCATLL